MENYRKEGGAKGKVEDEIRRERWEHESSKKEITRLKQEIAALEEENRKQVLLVKRLTGQAMSAVAGYKRANVDASLSELMMLGGR